MCSVASLDRLRTGGLVRDDLRTDGEEKQMFVDEGRDQRTEVGSQMTENSINELAHHLLNGIQVIKGLCAEGKVGKLTPWDVFDKIEHRAAGMEQAFRAIQEKRQMSEARSQNDTKKGATPFDRIKEQKSEIKTQRSEV